MYLLLLVDTSIFTFLLVNKHLYIPKALPELFSKKNLESIEKCEL